MNGKNIFDALRDIDPEWILDAAPTDRRHKRSAWVKWGTLAACLCLVVASVFGILYWLRANEYFDSTVPLHTHEFGEWQITKEATCVQMGEETRLCACGEKETKLVALLPHFAGAWVIEKEPTIKIPTPDDPTEREPGLMCQFCTHCGAKLNEELIPATGSLGLAYAINPDGKTFAVAGIGNCQDVDIIIPENFCGYHVTTVMDSAFMDCETVKTITLPDTVTVIGNQAFSFCENLTNITLPKELVHIGEKAFWYCENLESIEIPQSVTGIGKGAFASCYNLVNVTLPNGLKRLEDNLFASCLRMKTISLPDSLESIGDSVFESCASLQSIVIPSGVSTIGTRAFHDCKYLTQVVLPDGLRTISEYMFGYCYRLSGITIPQSVMHIEKYAFLHCISLVQIEIPQGVTIIGSYAFSNCYALEKVVLPDGLETIEEGAFTSCLALIDFDIPDSVSAIGKYAFSDCNALLEVEGGVVYVDNWAVALGENPYSFAVREGTVGIAAYAFYMHGNFTRVYLPGSLKYINQYAFAYAESLERIIFTGNQAQWISVKKTYAWAEGCKKIEIIYTGA